MLNLGAVWGIDVGDSAVKAVKLKVIGKQVVVQDFQVIRYSEIAGELGARRENCLPQAIAALQSAGLGREKCTVSIAPQAIFSRFISLPPVDKRRVPEIVLYEARQQIPFNLNEVIWAYESVRKEFIPGEEIEIGLFAVKREVLGAYLEELSPIWKQIQGIQVAPLGLYNFVRHEAPLDQPAVVMDIGAQSTDLLIIDGDKFWLRNLPIAGNSFSSILEKRLNITHADAEKLKYQIADSRHRRKLLEVLRPVMRDLLAEIQRSVGYYKSLSQAVKFEEILVTGEGFKLFGLDRFLGEQLQYGIKPIQELRNIVYQGDPARVQEFTETLSSLATAIGLGLQALGRGRSAINLLPEDFVIRRALGRKRYTGLIAAGIVWAMVGGLFVKESRTLQAVGEMENIGVSIIREVDRLKADYRSAQEGDAPERLKFFQTFGAQREYYARIIGAISAVIPREVQIDQFGINPGTRTIVTGGLFDEEEETEMGDDEELFGDDETTTTFVTSGPTVDIAALQGATFVLMFTATCDAVKEPVELEQRLPRQIRRAVIYPEEVEVVENVVVGQITGAGTPTLSAKIYVDLLSPEQAAQKRKDVIAQRAAEAQKAAAEAAKQAQSGATSEPEAEESLSAGNE